MSDRDSPVGSPAADKVDRQDMDDTDAMDQNASENGDAAAAGHDSDDALSEIDENQFEDYDPATADIEDRPIAVDEDVAKTLKASRRKRAEGETRKPKEGRREKKRTRDDDDGADGDFSDGKAPTRKSRRAAAEGRPRAAKATPEPENEDHLSPEERRQRAIERALDSALKKPKVKKRRQDEEDLENAIDDQIADLKIAMERACQHDNTAREEGRPATWKLQLLPRVVALLNRQDVQHTVLDPDTNFLQHVRFFLEPLSDGSLPAYNIQRDIFTALTAMPIQKEQLLSSAIGKVVYFYTLSKQPEVQIKRMAERLLGEWSRPLLKRTDDYRKRQIQTREFDYDALKATQRHAASQLTLTQRPSAQAARQAERDRILAQKVTNNRARPGGLPDSYTIAPVSTFDPNAAPDHRPIGASGAEAFRRMTAKAKKR